MKQFSLFLLSLIAILAVFVSILGEVKTIQLILNEYLFILLVFPLSLVLWLYKRKIRAYNIKGVLSQSISLKSTVLFFLLFEIIDYYYEGGFEGMISQWFLYWIMGLLGFVVVELMYTIKLYKLLKVKNPQ